MPGATETITRSHTWTDSPSWDRWPFDRVSRRDLVSSANANPSRRRHRLLRHCRGLRGRSPTARRYGPDPRSGISINFGGEPTDTACRYLPRSPIRISVNRRGEPADTDCVIGFILPHPDRIRDASGFTLSGSFSVDVHTDADRPEPPAINDTRGPAADPSRVHAPTGHKARRLQDARCSSRSCLHARRRHDQRPRHHLPSRDT
jgi:hypothetical protein